MQSFHCPDRRRSEACRGESLKFPLVFSVVTCSCGSVHSPKLLWGPTLQFKFIDAHTQGPRVYPHFPYTRDKSWPSWITYSSRSDQHALEACCCWRLLPAFQKSLASQHSLVLHFQSTRPTQKTTLEMVQSHLYWLGLECSDFCKGEDERLASTFTFNFFRCLSQCDAGSFPLKTEHFSDRMFWCSSWVQGGLIDHGIILLLGTPLDAPHNTRPIGPCCWLPEEQL